MKVLQIIEWDELVPSPNRDMCIEGQNFSRFRIQSKGGVEMILTPNRNYDRQGRGGDSPSSNRATYRKTRIQDLEIILNPFKVKSQDISKPNA